MKRIILLAVLVALFQTQFCRAQVSPLDVWTWRSPYPTGNDLHNIIYANGQFLAVGEYGIIITSLDGANWSQRYSMSVGSKRRS
jgi:hypothetical protein